MPTQSNTKTSFTQCPFCYGSNENHHEPCRSGGGVFAIKNKNNWEEEFDRVFGIETDQMLPHYKKYRSEVKSFIRSLLHTTRQNTVEEIRKAFYPRFCHDLKCDGRCLYIGGWETINDLFTSFKSNPRVNNCGACGAILNNGKCPLGHDPENPTIPKHTTRQKEIEKIEKMFVKNVLLEEGYGNQYQVGEYDGHNSAITKVVSSLKSNI